MLLMMTFCSLAFISCKREQQSEPEHIHVEVIDQEVPAFCGQDGLTAGAHCGECGDILREQEPIPPKRPMPCDPIWIYVEQPSKTTDGIKSLQCMICGRNFGEEIVYAGSQNLKYEQNPDGTYYVSGVSRDEDMDIVIPEKYNGQPITGIGSEAITDGVVSLALNSYITSIDENAFEECRTLACITVSADNPSFCAVDGNLYSKDGKTLVKYAPAKPSKAFVVPDGVSAVGNSAFLNAKSLESIQFSQGLASVGKQAFAYCDALKSITFPEGLVSVGQGAFYHCLSLQTVYIPDSATEIGKFLFEYCRALESVTLPAGLREIPDGTFFGCVLLQSVNIPANITRVGAKSFLGCYLLQEIILPDGVQAIGESAFDSCEGLLRIHIPRSVTSIGNWAFEKCESLQEFDVAADNAVYESVDGNLYDKKNKVLLWYAIGKQDEAFVLPDGVTGIGEKAFTYAKYIRHVEIPDSVTVIGRAAFAECGMLTSVVMGKGLFEIPEYAFFNCYALASMTLSGNVTRIGEYAFNWCGKLTEIVFDGTAEQWEAVEKQAHWNDGVRECIVYCNDGTVSIDNAAW